MWLDLLAEWADGVSPNQITVKGQWGVIYTVHSVREIDKHLRGLNIMLTRLFAEQVSEQTIPAYRRIRAEQDLLLDARLRRMRRG